MRKLASANENPNLFKTEATCDGRGWDQEGRQPCYALWEITAKDIRKRIFMNHGSDIYYGFICPDCGCFTELDKTKIPSHVKNTAIRYTGNWDTDVY